jgi:pullulanase
MIAEGQEWMRSKRGVNNSYNRGDEINALRWTERAEPLRAATLAYYRGLIRLRNSPEGAAFRLADRPPADYYRWIEPAEGRALGYLVNADAARPGSAFVVLLNAADREVGFDVLFPAGRWRLIGDGDRLDRGGLPEHEAIEGPRQQRVEVPGPGSLVWMREPS